MAPRQEKQRLCHRQQPPRLKPPISCTSAVLILACCGLASVAQGFAVRPCISGCKNLRVVSSLNTRGKGTGGGSGSLTMMASGHSDRRRTLVVIGGGAAGYFGAIQAASSSGGGGGGGSGDDERHMRGKEDNKQNKGWGKLNVLVLEAGKLPLQKVKISGGGRCNVIHDASKPVSLIAQGYPRGRKQLIGPFKSLFGPTDAAAWFRARGVTLKTEADGRMFPVTDNSQTIIDCLEGAARKAAVQVVTSAKVTSISHHQAAPFVRNDDDNDADDDDDEVADNTHHDDVDKDEQAISSRFDLTFTTAKPLSPAVRKAMGAVVVATAAAAVAATTTADDGSLQRNTPKTNLYGIACDFVLQATGASREGHAWAKGLGHAVSNPVPSLFTLTIKDPRLEGLAGLSVQDAELKLFAAEQKPAAKEQAVPSMSRTKNDQPSDSGATASRHEGGGGRGGGGNDLAAAGNIQNNNSNNNNNNNNNNYKAKKGKKKVAVSQRGPLLITHTGVSGPAALKLSAFGARQLNEGGYRGRLVVNWLAGSNLSKTLDELQDFRARNVKKTVYSFCPVDGGGGGGRDGAGASSPPALLPRRLWQSLALAAGVEAGDKWADVSKKKLSALAQQLTACDLQVMGKGSFKEEFVTCGGVALSGLDMRTMESRNIPGLFFAGEVVDIDGITGGFNFQSAWTTGWVAGSAIAAKASAVAAAAAAGGGGSGGRHREGTY